MTIGLFQKYSVHPCWEYPFLETVNPLEFHQNFHHPQEFFIILFLSTLEFHQNSYHPLKYFNIFASTWNFIKILTTPWNFPRFFPSTPWNFQNSNPLKFRCPQQGVRAFFLEKSPFFMETLETNILINFNFLHSFLSLGNYR